MKCYQTSHVHRKVLGAKLSTSDNRSYKEEESAGSEGKWGRRRGIMGNLRGDTGDVNLRGNFTRKARGNVKMNVKRNLKEESQDRHQWGNRRERRLEKNED